MRSRLDSRLVDLSNAVYGRILQEASRRDRLWYLATVFDGVADQVWIDEWGHVTPSANRLIADQIATALVP